MKKTIIIGASPLPERYSYMATERLSAKGHPVVPLGVRKGKIGENTILNDRPMLEDVDTITLYVNPDKQLDWEAYILATHPKRVIFNPGTENPDLASRLNAAGIETTEACTLVLLSIDQY